MSFFLVRGGEQSLNTLPLVYIVTKCLFYKVSDFNSNMAILEGYIYKYETIISLGLLHCMSNPREMVCSKMCINV